MKPFKLVLAFAAAMRLACGQIPQPTDAPKPRTPEQSASAFKLPDGFRMEVVASEPLIASPSGVCWDEHGRMFVCELHGYNLEGQLDIEELNKTGKLDTQVRRVEADDKFKQAAKAGTYGVVKLLADTNGDGRMDSVTVWTTNLPPAYGIVPARGGVIVACPPDIVFLADRDGDGKPDVREVLFTGFRVGEMWRGINCPQWGYDGWIYFGRGWGGSVVTGPKLAKSVALPDTDFRIRSDGSAIEPVTGGSGTFGFAMTEAGDRFGENTTIPAIYFAPLPWTYLARNPNATTPSLEAATGDRRAYSLSKPHPWRQKRADDPAYFKFYNSRYGAAESEADGWFTAACGPLVYRDHALPGLHGQYFVCEPSGNLIHRAIIEQQQSVLTIHRAPGEEKSEFGATTDQWSHPINLSQGPDGSIWVVDYYREIIEDYSAIPRHLQQQYGVYHGHDRGRIYRLTHRDAPRAPSADMGAMDATALARECASPLLWRRQTAQRLLVERGEQSAAGALREILADKTASGASIISALRTLDQLRALSPKNVERFLSNPDAAVRVHTLQLADRSFRAETKEGRAILDAALSAVPRETNARVQIQFALSLGEARDPRAFSALTRLAREQIHVRWMDAAILSSVADREVDFMAELLRDAGKSQAFLPKLAQTIAARRDDTDLARTLKLLGYGSIQTQAAVLDGLAKGRKNAPRKELADSSGRAALAEFIGSASPDVRKAAQALEQTFGAAAANDEEPTASTGKTEQVTEETFRKFVTALAEKRDLKRGHEIYLQACATCHRMGEEGHEVGPDLMGQLGIAEQGLLKDILLPSERIRPGYETTEVKLRDNSVITGILKDDGATSLLLVQAGGIEQSVLRKDVAAVKRLATSLMPPFGEGITPADLANLLAWLRSFLGPSAVDPGAKQK